MIRHVVLGRLEPDADREAMRALLQGSAALRTPGLLDRRADPGERLRDQTWAPPA